MAAIDATRVSSTTDTVSLPSSAIYALPTSLGTTRAAGFRPTGAVPRRSPVAESNAVTRLVDAFVAQTLPRPGRDGSRVAPAGSDGCASSATAARSPEPRVVVEVRAIEKAGDGALGELMSCATALTVAIYVPAARRASVAEISAEHSTLTCAGLPRFCASMGSA